MSRREWIARSRSLVAAVVLLAVPLATDTRSDQDQTLPGASAAGAPVPLPPELARYGGDRDVPPLRFLQLPRTITIPHSPPPPHALSAGGRLIHASYLPSVAEAASTSRGHVTRRCLQR